MNNRTRKPNRLQNYDYSRTGYYFVTICTQNRKELFGKIIDSQMITNAAGEMLAETWRELPKFYSGIQIDQFQIMPNHVHGIIVIGDGPCSVSHGGGGQPQGVVPTRNDRVVIVGDGPCSVPHGGGGQPQGVVPTCNDRVVIVGDGPCAVPHGGTAPTKPGDVRGLSLSDVVHRFKTLTTRLYIQGVKKKGWEPFDAKLWQRSFFDHVIRNEESLNKVRAYIRDNPLNWALDKDNLAYQEGFLI